MAEVYGSDFQFSKSTGYLFLRGIHTQAHSHTQRDFYTNGPTRKDGKKMRELEEVEQQSGKVIDKDNGMKTPNYVVKQLWRVSRTRSL